MENHVHSKSFLFVANNACLDFVNTQIVNRGRPVDLLESFADLISWLVQAKLIGAADGDAAAMKWGGRRSGNSVFQKALEFRTVLTLMVERSVGGKPVKEESVNYINEILRHRLGYAKIVRAPSGFLRGVVFDVREPCQLLVPVAEAASDLLCASDLTLVKKCRNPGCVLYFYDTTKNHARRWCSMSVCGNRMKVAAYSRRAHPL